MEGGNAGGRDGWRKGGREGGNDGGMEQRMDRRGSVCGEIVVSLLPFAAMLSYIKMVLQNIQTIFLCVMYTWPCVLRCVFQYADVSPPLHKHTVYLLGERALVVVS